MNETMVGATYDNLEVGTLAPLIVHNVACSSDTTIERGMLLAGEYDGSNVTVAHAALPDTVESMLYVAMRDEEEGSTVTSVYVNGVFNRKAIKLDEGLNIRMFEKSMRMQNLQLVEVL